MKRILVLAILTILTMVLTVGCTQNVPSDEILLGQPIVEPAEQMPEVLYLVTDYYPEVSPEYV